MNRPQRDEAMVPEAGISLDRALFPLLVGIERLGPIGVVDLADRVGRDYTTVSRQVSKLKSLGLIRRQCGAEDCRVREAIVTPGGKVMTDAVDAARERPGRAIFAKWQERDFEALVRLLRKFAADIEGHLAIGKRTVRSPVLPPVHSSTAMLGGKRRRHMESSPDGSFNDPHR